MCQAAHKGRNRPDVSTEMRRDTFGFRFIEAHAQEARRLLSIRRSRFPRFFVVQLQNFLRAD